MWDSLQMLIDLDRIGHNVILMNKHMTLLFIAGKCHVTAYSDSAIGSMGFGILPGSTSTELHL